MDSSFIKSALMGIFSAIILGSFTILLLLVLLRWCLCNLCGPQVVRRNVIYDTGHSALRIGIYDSHGLAAVIDQRPRSTSVNVEDKISDGLPSYDEAVGNSHKPGSVTKTTEIVVDPMKL